MATHRAQAELVEAYPGVITTLRQAQGERGESPSASLREPCFCDANGS